MDAVSEPVLRITFLRAITQNQMANSSIHIIKGLHVKIRSELIIFLLIYVWMNKQVFTVEKFGIELLSRPWDCR